MVFSPTFLSDKAMFFPPLTISSSSRDERCDERCRKVIGKLLVSRCMALGPIFLTLNYSTFLALGKNPFLKQDVKSRKFLNLFFKFYLLG